MSAKSCKRGNPYVRRKHVLSGKLILIVTEGEKTEPDYLEGLRKRLQLHRSHRITVSNAVGTDPLSVVNTAISMRGARARQARRGRADVAPYDAVWAVFDTERADTNPQLEPAKQEAKNHEIKIALSNPCFEFWLLLHDEYTTASLAKYADVEKRIKKYVPKYDKANIPIKHYIPDKQPNTSDKVAEAVERAKLCRTRHEGDMGTAWNPYTEMDKLVLEINKLARICDRLIFSASAKNREQSGVRGQEQSSPRAAGLRPDGA